MKITTAKGKSAFQGSFNYMKYVKTGRGSGGGSTGPSVSPKVQKERGGGGQQKSERKFTSSSLRIMVIIICILNTKQKDWQSEEVLAQR